MPDEKIKIIQHENFSHDPVAELLFMDSLIAFQYGEGDEAREAQDFLFGDSVNGLAVKDFDELQLVLPDLDFWIELGRKWQATEQVSLRLYANKGLESRIAANLLQEEGLHFTTIDVQRKAVGEIALPAFVDASNGACYRSFVGIKSFLRSKILEEHGVTDSNYHLQKDLKFYQSWDFDAKPAKQFHAITCFNENNEVTYAGDINHAPHPAKKVLDKHPFKDWHEVASFEVGRWQEILRNRDKARILDAKRKVVLFPEEVKSLESGGEVVIHDSGSMYEVHYEAYFKDSEKLYRLYAYMLD